MGTVLVCGSFLFLGTLLFQPVGFCTQERMTAPPAESAAYGKILRKCGACKVIVAFCSPDCCAHLAG